MSRCKDCRGQGLKVFHDPALDHGRGKFLYTDDECPMCGGKGYVSEGERPFDVDVYLNDKRIVNIAVLAVHSIDAIIRAGDLLRETHSVGFKPGDTLYLEVEEQ